MGRVLGRIAQGKKGGNADLERWEETKSIAEHQHLFCRKHPKRWEKIEAVVQRRERRLTRGIVARWGIRGRRVA